MNKIPAISPLDLVLIYIETHQNDENDFDTMRKEMTFKELVLASLLSDLQLAELAVYVRKNSGYFVNTEKGKKKAIKKMDEILNWYHIPYEQY